MALWTEKEVEYLTNLVNNGKGFVEIAVLMKRPILQVSTKSRRLGLKNSFRANVGENNGQWKGTAVHYGCLHKWVRRNKPIPDHCEICGVKRNRLDCANISGEYKRDLNDWIFLCRRCHMKTDGRLKIWNLNRIMEMKTGINLPPKKRTIPRTCIVCGKEFLSVLNTKDTCGINCYKKIWRRTKQEKKNG
jgi:hypothetical protein